MQLHITRPLLLRRPLTQLRRRAWQSGGLARKGLGRAYKIGGLPPLAPKASASELPRFWYGGVPTPPLTQEPTGLFVLPGCWIHPVLSDSRTLSVCAVRLLRYVRGFIWLLAATGVCTAPQMQGFKVTGLAQVMR